MARAAATTVRNGTSGATATVGANGMVGNFGGTTAAGGVGTNGAGVPGAGGNVVSTGGLVASAGTPAAGGSTGPLCGGPAIPANKGRCSTSVVTAKGSALMIHDFEDAGPDNDYLGVFFGEMGAAANGSTATT